jgi:hypothetical protein
MTRLVFTANLGGGDILAAPAEPDGRDAHFLVWHPREEYANGQTAGDVYVDGIFDRAHRRLVLVPFPVFCRWAAFFLHCEAEPPCVSYSAEHPCGHTDPVLTDTASGRLYSEHCECGHFRSPASPSAALARRQVAEHMGRMQAAASATPVNYQKEATA